MAVTTIAEPAILVEWYEKQVAAGMAETASNQRAHRIKRLARFDGVDPRDLDDGVLDRYRRAHSLGPDGHEKNAQDLRAWQRWRETGRVRSDYRQARPGGVSKLPKSVEKFRKHLRGRGYAENTCDNYANIVERVARHNSVKPKKIKARHIENYFADKRPGEGTRGAYVAALRKFARWANIPDPTYDMHATQIEADPRPAMPAQVFDLIGRAKAMAASRHARTRKRGKRLYAMLILGSFAGLRACEIARVHRLHLTTATVTDPNRPGQTMTVHRLEVIGKGKLGKTSKGKHIIVPEIVAEVILGYAGELFPDLNAEKVSRYLATFARGNGHDLTAHQFRHFYGTFLYRECKDPYFVRDQLRHKDGRMTEHYVRIVKQEEYVEQIEALTIDPATRTPEVDQARFDLAA
ncbi:tyrosine-type recombinase/integrase [Catenulispora pinisilvae]|uniref:tyrosine-type recombinase/integrase n=1 Tax=Catenulispora pinisilvae TaxID=2705253 RepID=UPI001891B05C|nr:site-specific integrase [Catenulispora pinisilvae]